MMDGPIETAILLLGISLVILAGRIEGKSRYPDPRARIASVVAVLGGVIAIIAIGFLAHS